MTKHLSKKGCGSNILFQNTLDSQAGTDSQHYAYTNNSYPALTTVTIHATPTPQIPPGHTDPHRSTPWQGRQRFSKERRRIRPARHHHRGGVVHRRYRRACWRAGGWGNGEARRGVLAPLGVLRRRPPRWVQWKHSNEKIKDHTQKDSENTIPTATLIGPNSSSEAPRDSSCIGDLSRRNKSFAILWGDANGGLPDAPRSKSLIEPELASTEYLLPEIRNNFPVLLSETRGWQTKRHLGR